MSKNSLILNTPINWQQELIPFLSERGISRAYGKLNGDFIRASSCVSENEDLRISKKEALKYIKELGLRGIKFTYIIDSVCINNLEWVKEGQKRIRSFLDDLTFLGVDSVSVSMPYLVELVKKRYPGLGIEISSSAEVDDLPRAKHWEDLGADVITLASYKINRDFALLKKICDNVKCGLQLIPNHSCLNNCINHLFHTSTVSHGQSNESLYCGLECLGQMMEAKYKIISSQWIRPEDLGIYEEIGIDRLQLQDANISSRDIIRIVEAYSKRLYEGNLADLFPRLSHSSFLKGSIAPVVSLNNLGLNGFIQYFLAGKCKSFCAECGYCKDIAETVVSINEQAAKNISALYTRHLINDV